jgi:hypothetical protein
MLKDVKQMKRNLENARAIHRNDEAEAKAAEERAAQNLTPGDAAKAARAKANASNEALKSAESNFSRSFSAETLPWAEYLADTNMQLVRSFLSEAEQNRIDKQVGSGANTSGTTSLVSRGSVPALFGLAVENGAATQETSGTTITFRANPTGLIKALVKRDYLESGRTEILPIDKTQNDEPKASDLWYRILNRASVAVSYDTSKGPNSGTFTAERSQLASYSVHYDIINHRDPRDKENLGLWRELRQGAGTSLAAALTLFGNALREMKEPGAPEATARKEYDLWRDQSRTELLAASLDDIEETLFRRAEALRAIVSKHPEIVALIETVVIPAANTYAASRVALLNQVSKSISVSFDYSNTRQVVTLGETESRMITLPTGMTNDLPNLGNFLLTASGRFIGQSEITANISGTRFNGRRVGPNIGRWRDARAGLQIDVPLPKIRMDWEKPTLTFSYLYLNLLEEPLGEKILVNGVEQSRKGPINFGQVKLEIPTGLSGVRIPISMTFSNRTELIKESQVRGHIGITFDFDKIFSRPQ